MRVAAIDTGAIEGLYAVDRGFTMSVASMASTWEAEIGIAKGADVAALIAAQRAGYDLALDAATAATAITEAWIRRLHEVVCAAQDEYDVRTAAGPQRHLLPKGAYKSVPNHVELADGSIHPYAPVETTPAEMHRLVEELRSAEFGRAHPVVQASYAHFALVCVHPFSDGNGRVARALASVFLLRAISLPFVVFADQKDSYLDSLSLADLGRPQAFVDFVLFRAVDLQQLLTQQLSAARGPSLEDAAARLRDTAAHPEILKLLEVIRNELQTQLGALDLPASVSWSVTVAQGGGFSVELPPPSRPAIHVVISTTVPRAAKVEEFLSVFASQAPEAELPGFSITRQTRRRETLTVRPDEVRPAISAALQYRLSAWLGRVLAEKVTEVTRHAQKL